jgi:CDP-diacylglycerol--serine O-phosphatidyltransferase
MRFIGFYDYTVILTYVSLISGVVGMKLAFCGRIGAAICCLVLSGVCDLFDGVVARSKKNRTVDEKNFGIQLDSLCDVVCFGVLPAIILYFSGVDSILGVAILALYVLCAVIRLAFFNVLETKRQQEEGGCNKTYRGLPVTSIAFILPMTFWLQFLVPELVFLSLLHLVLLVTGFLFVLDFPLRKPDLKQILIMICIAAVTVGSIFAFTKLRLPHYRDRSNHIIQEIFGDANETETP